MLDEYYWDWLVACSLLKWYYVLGGSFRQQWLDMMILNRVYKYMMRWNEDGTTRGMMG